LKGKGRAIRCATEQRAITTGTGRSLQDREKEKKEKEQREGKKPGLPGVPHEKGEKKNRPA